MSIADFIEKNIKLNDRPVKLYAYQKKILKDPSDFRIVNKSRQIGVTQLAAWEALVYALANNNELIGIISVSERQAKDVIIYISNAYYSLPANLRLKLVVESKQELKFENGSRILSLPNNPRTIRGKKFTRIYPDELAHYQQDKEIMDALLPSISRGGKATFISTPLGKQGEFYRLWADADGMSRHEIPFKECPDILPRINLIKSKMDIERFKQEYECQFLDETTSMFPYGLIKSCIDDELKNEIPETQNPIYMGMDFGKKIDSTVIIGIEVTETHIFVRYINEFLPPLIYSNVSEFIKRNFDRWKPTKIFIDQTGVGEKIIEDLSSLGSVVIGQVFTAPFKEKIIQNLKVAMQDGKIKIPRNENLINQLHSLEKKISESGIVRYKHPSRGKIQHDDYVWALALAVYGQENVVATGSIPRPLGGSVFNINKKREDRIYRKDY